MASRAIHKRLTELTEDSPVSAVDLFCGAGGLTHGLMQAGIKVEAGIDLDESAKHAFTTNNPGVSFFPWDVAGKNYTSIEKLFDSSKHRLLAGCAPCQPFSKLTNGVAKHHAWDLLDNFGRFVRGILPELVTMENVPGLVVRGRPVFDKFIGMLKKHEYEVAWDVVKCHEYGIPQSRERLVLLASRLGKMAVPKKTHRSRDQWQTVRQTIADLPPLESGRDDPSDPLHAASKLSDKNLRRIRATRHDGGTRQDWPSELVLECHKKKSGESYGSIYGRMWWDRPAPTMTTLCTGLGNGRFGHPEQDRSITLREAALLQSVPLGYEFWPSDKTVNHKAVGRMIGNAVPPMLAKALGQAIIKHVEGCGLTPEQV